MAAGRRHSRSFWIESALFGRVISVAEHSPFGHPHADVLDRLEKRHVPALRTDRDGAIRIGTDGKILEVNLFRDGQ